MFNLLNNEEVSNLSLLHQGIKYLYNRVGVNIDEFIWDKTKYKTVLNVLDSINDGNPSVADDSRKTSLLMLWYLLCILNREYAVELANYKDDSGYLEGISKENDPRVVSTEVFIHRFKNFI